MTTDHDTIPECASLHAQHGSDIANLKAWQTAQNGALLRLGDRIDRMNTWLLVIVGGVVVQLVMLVVNLATKKAGGTVTPRFVAPTAGGLRGEDAWGDGAFLASRAGRPHWGCDYLASPGDVVRSPVEGVVLRQKRPYADDLSYSGLLIRTWDGWLVTLFYVSPLLALLGSAVGAGCVVGAVQDLTPRYPATASKPAIPCHVHVEVVAPPSWQIPTAFRLGHEYTHRVLGPSPGLYVALSALVGIAPKT